ncbi:conjugal transfer pilin signal peptidase TrbI [Pseudoduganella lurida]|uniref:Conjugal transfer pilin signal peptidase TrbI n=1 Tax=Pseudoduganella lurida TaxID=1036180 RepID=A0A562RL08_9BURK|nr:S26 family signal peptidase [Pseudoduganella lurida]TWI69294.1 conjugal transfer pilin signal peptidase TrbI [Pseudoduganella lurida]
MASQFLSRLAFVARGLLRHLVRQWSGYLVVGALAVWSYLHYRIGVNVSGSLPGHVYLIELDMPPTRVGQLVAFTWQRNAFYRPERLFIKQVRGVPGQCVTRVGRQVFVDGRPQGTAKPASRQGIPLEPIAPGIIPCGYLYVGAPHPDSLDSRYRITGLVGPERIVGRAYELF